MLYHYKNLKAESIKVLLANGTTVFLPGHGELEHSFPIADQTLLESKTLRQISPRPKITSKQAVPWAAPKPMVHPEKKEEGEADPGEDPPKAEAPAPKDESEEEKAGVEVELAETEESKDSAPSRRNRRK